MTYRPFRGDGPSTWQVLKEVDKLMAHVPDWQPGYWSEHRQGMMNYSTERHKKQRKRKLRY